MGILTLLASAALAGVERGGLNEPRLPAADGSEQEVGLLSYSVGGALAREGNRIEEQVMDVMKLRECLAGIPHMTPEQGQAVTQFICQHNLRNCLELGFAHGAGTAYIANAVQALGGGQVVAIDLVAARQRRPDIYETLARAGIDPATVELYFEQSSYNWRMMKFLEKGRAGTFDFVYLDGAHSWDVDGLAYILSEKLLRPGGWLLFDDINWTFDSPTLAGRAWVQNMPPEERRTPQVRKIWELLVKHDPQFDVLMEKNDWAFARKTCATAERQIVYRYHPAAELLLTLKNDLRRTVRRLAGRGRTSRPGVNRSGPLA